MDLVIAGGNELHEAQAQIWNHTFNYINSMSLKCAVQLGIPDAIHRHGPNVPMPLSQLVSALQLDPLNANSISRLMRILAHSGFFVVHKLTKINVERQQQQQQQQHEEDGYALTNSSRLLVKDHPLTLAPFLLSMLDPIFVEPWQFLSVWFQTNNNAPTTTTTTTPTTPTPFDMVYGTSFWEYVGNSPKDNEVFNAAMASDARLVMSILLGEYKGVFFEGVGSLVDVGGGTGTMAKAIAEAFHDTQCIVLDLPHVVANLEGDYNNFKYIGGDMFQSIPSADALLLKWMLHVWSDEDCVKILKKCKEAITNDDGKKGKVIVIDMVVGNKQGDDKFVETQLFFDMMLMTMVGGKERNEKEWAQLFNRAGFSDYKIFPILGLRSLIEIYP